MSDERKIRRGEVEHFDHFKGGEGEGKYEHILGTKDMGVLNMFAKTTLEPKATIGFHVCEEGAEAYYILKGQGVYTDGTKTFVANPGDLFYCAKGESHSISNAGEENLEFITVAIGE